MNENYFRFFGIILSIIIALLFAIIIIVHNIDNRTLRLKEMLKEISDKLDRRIK